MENAKWILVSNCINMLSSDDTNNLVDVIPAILTRIHPLVVRLRLILKFECEYFYEWIMQ